MASGQDTQGAEAAAGLKPARDADPSRRRRPRTPVVVENAPCGAKTKSAAAFGGGGGSFEEEEGAHEMGAAAVQRLRQEAAAAAAGAAAAAAVGALAWGVLAAGWQPYLHSLG